MRNFGANRGERRPDVRFCGVKAAGDERARVSDAAYREWYAAAAAKAPPGCTRFAVRFIKPDDVLGEPSAVH
jgi:hypothetical protein